MARLSRFLEGVRIIDLSRYIPGPLATLVLCDLGAEVIKIEPPVGDEMRTLGPKAPDGSSIFFEALNAGKLSLRLDLKSGEGRERLLQLVDTADVVLEAFRPGVMDRLGLSYARLSALNPALIYCSLNGYGTGGSLSHFAGHDAQYMASSGVLFRNGAGSGPSLFDPPISDCAGALWAATAIVGALHGRRRDKRGCHIDLALADGLMPLQVFQLAALGRAGVDPGPRTTYLNGGAAFYNVYRTSDGRHVALGTLETKFWQVFCLKAGRPEWIARHTETLPQEKLQAALADYFGQRTLSECAGLFQDPECCCSPVLTLEEAASCAYHRERGLLPRDELGAWQPLFPARVDRETAQVRPPLRQLGDTQFDALLRRKRIP